MDQGAMRGARQPWLTDTRLDRAFDGLVPTELRHLSSTHWTPVAVAIRAASLLCPTKDMRVLDVGAGVGKFCAVGALSAFGTWCGVEQHGSLVAAARRLTRALGVEQRTAFVHGDAFAVDWSEYDALYLYNPLEPPAFDPSTPSVDAARGRTAYRVQVAHMEQRLARLPQGVRVVTLHGFGGVMPSSFDLLYQEHIGIAGCDLVLWVQRSGGRTTLEKS
jgi:hypothetical protein